MSLFRLTGWVDFSPWLTCSEMEIAEESCAAWHPGGREKHAGDPRQVTPQRPTSPGLGWDQHSQLWSHQQADTLLSAPPARSSPLPLLSWRLWVDILDLNPNRDFVRAVSSRNCKWELKCEGSKPEYILWKQKQQMTPILLRSLATGFWRM